MFVNVHFVSFLSTMFEKSVATESITGNRVSLKWSVSPVVTQLSIIAKDTSEFK
jgi:hypothetical protein